MKHFEREVDNLKRKLLGLSAIVEDRVWQAVKAVVEMDAALAESVIAGDEEIDQYEVDVEEDCLKLLALYHPVATDLRFIIAVLKINNDIERIGDLAVNIAKSVRYLAERRISQLPFDFHDMAARARAMLRRSLDAFVNLDEEAASQIIKQDDAVDAMRREMVDRMKAEMQRQPAMIEVLLRLMEIPKRLERIADQATNIAEDVIYLVKGEIARHRADAEAAPSMGV